MASDSGPHHSQLFDALPVRREVFQERLYRAAQAAKPSDTRVDELLAEHRRLFGEPEQVAYAERLDTSDLRPPRDETLLFEQLALRFCHADATLLSGYLTEHRRWCR